MQVYHRRLHVRIWRVLAFVLPALLICFAIIHRFALMSTAFYAKPQVVLSVPAPQTPAQIAPAPKP